MKRCVQVWLIVVALVVAVGQASAATIADFQWTEDAAFTGDVEFRLTNQDILGRPITAVELYVDSARLADAELSAITLGGLGVAAFNVNPAAFIPDVVQTAMFSFVFEGLTYSGTLTRADLAPDALYSAYGYKTFDYSVPSIPEPAVLSLLACAAGVLVRRRLN